MVFEIMDEKRYDVDAVKRRLIRYREREKDIDNQIERLERLQMKMESVGSPVITDMPKTISPSHDRIADLVERKIELEDSIRNDVKFQSDERKFFENILKAIIKSDERAVIRMRYFDGARWDDVVDMMFGGKEDFLGKEDTYLRRVHKIHGTALLDIARYIEENQNPDKI